jgi:hypothetical protein
MKRIHMKILRLLMPFALIVFTPIVASAEPFQHLSVLQVKGAYMDSVVRYNKATTRILNEPVKDSYHTPVRVLITRIFDTSGEEYLVIFDPGPSFDPVFKIYRVSNGKEQEIKTIPGEELIIPGNGDIYSIVLANEYFNKRRKYSLKGEALEEIKQPFYYVGLVSKTRMAIDLYADFDLVTKIAHLPEDSDIEVLINKDYNYLIKTPFGLLGWAQLRGGCGEEAIKGLCYHGD